MREIKFLAWSGSAKSMSPSFTLTELAKTGFNFEEMHDIKWMQFTGLHDRNGVEIYEGDVLRCENKYVWHVSMNDSGCFVAHTPEDIREFVLLDDYDFAVIGNIHCFRNS